MPAAPAPRTKNPTSTAAPAEVAPPAEPRVISFGLARVLVGPPKADPVEARRTVEKALAEAEANISQLVESLYRVSSPALADRLRKEEARRDQMKAELAQLQPVTPEIKTQAFVAITQGTKVLELIAIDAPGDRVFSNGRLKRTVASLIDSHLDFDRAAAKYRSSSKTEPHRVLEYVGSGVSTEPWEAFQVKISDGRASTISWKKPTVSGKLTRVQALEFFKRGLVDATLTKFSED